MMMVDGMEVNTYPNSAYNKTRKTYSGTLSHSEHEQLIRKLELELDTSLGLNKPILINFNQGAPNCIFVNSTNAAKRKVLDNRIRMSSRLSTQYNAVDFFVYAENAFDKHVLRARKETIQDSGFFYQNIFTEHENCAGFIIIKPSGTFYKYYGEDYYSEVHAAFANDDSSN